VNVEVEHDHRAQLVRPEADSEIHTISSPDTGICVTSIIVGFSFN
jgi:hypothetical protein